MAGKATDDALAGPVEAPAHDHRAHRALSDTKRHLRRRALELLLYVLVAYVVLRLIPTLEQAVHSLENVAWEWVLGAVAIEVISFVSRPLSLSVRLFANMLAGHIALKIFASFIVALAGAGVLTAIISPLPFALTIALVALDLLVAVLQAYVFATLTCVYLNDALHPGH